MEMGKFQGIELGEVELREDNVLSIEPTFQLKKSISDRINRVLQTLISRHVVHILQNFSKMSPILHEQHTSSINIQYLY